MLNFEFYGENYPITFSVNRYCNNNNLAILMYSNTEGYPECFASMTVNFDCICKENCAFVDTNGLGEEIESFIQRNKLGTPTGVVIKSGFCSFPEYEFDMEKIYENLG